MTKMADIHIKLDGDLEKIVKVRCRERNCIHNRGFICNLKNIVIETGGKCRDAILYNDEETQERKNERSR